MEIGKKLQCASLLAAEARGGGAAPATRGSISTVFLSAPYCSHFARIRNLAQERRTGRGVSGGYLPFFSGIVQHGARGACNGTRAHTRAHTHQAVPITPSSPSSPPHFLLSKRGARPSHPSKLPAESRLCN
jgi:hypothetical protein